MQNTIKTAIVSKNLVEFTYSGHMRVVEPHVLGVKSDVVQLLGYQVGGGSGSGGIPEWRRFDLQKTSGVKIKAETFPCPRPCPTGQHSEWDRIIACVKP